MNVSRGDGFNLHKGELTLQVGNEDITANRDYSKLRKSAASQSLSKLKEAISLGGWTAQDIDDNDAYNQSKGKQKQRQHASKSALHMAAWKGCLDNVRYLIETVGCDINAYSKQEFSHGKTAIFFALTQSRPDITEYLLRMEAKVTIVNNKGQSVLSMAATHFEDAPDGRENEIIRTIRELETRQGNWWNFRATHSDGFEYGDLDPRFFNDRPLRDTDVVTPLAINPTNKKTRKGGFLRRNPGAAAKCPFGCTECFRCGKATSKQPKNRDRKKAQPPPILSAEVQSQLDRAWESLLTTAKPTSSSKTLDREILLEILRLSDKQRSSWIPQATMRLTEEFGNACSLRGIEEAMKHPNRPTQRLLQLLEKILVRLQAGNQQQEDKEKYDTPKSRERSSEGDDVSDHSFDSSELWMAARRHVAGLHISCLENTESLILSLPGSPVFVDNPDALRNVLAEMPKARLVAIDTEWYTPLANTTAGKDPKPKAALSTLQLSVWNDSTRYLDVYVIDLMDESPAASNREYHRLAQSLVRTLLEACGNAAMPELPLVLGFAIRHDLPMLQGFLVDDTSDETCGDSSREAPPESIARHNRFGCPRVLDLQSVFVTENVKIKQHRSKTFKPTTSSNLPGLKACVSRYASLPLSKDCQCSDWGRRPLSEAQLEYAGLDAAILLVLLAERSRERV